MAEPPPIEARDLTKRYGSTTAVDVRDSPPMRTKLVVTRAPHSASTRSSISSRPSIR